ncbi:MAG TPA: HemK/PrmC family methyltransferase [Candidatus Andersenbacteria bacterium]|nr:HemK/PrmC family methyltransferase [Candidatus Andersenbacteria bacterium]
MNIQELQHEIATMLRDFSDAPQLDAQRIILHVLKKNDASYLLSHGDEIFSDADLETMLERAEKRKIGMPLAYIVGQADFYGRTFFVTQDVLIPRPDTELLIEKTLKYIQNNFDTDQDVLIADVCTGSGCIAITLALELPHARIIATDISPAAIEIAKRNAKQHGVLDRIEFLHGDMFDAFSPPARGGVSPAFGGVSGGGRKVDLIVSNPPYVTTQELLTIRHPGLDPGSTSNDESGFPIKSGMTTNDTIGLLFEPKIALDGGEDGLKFVNQIKEYSKKHSIPAIIETVGGEIITVY